MENTKQHYVMCGTRVEGGAYIATSFEEAHQELRNCWTSRIHFVGTQQECEQELQRIFDEE